MAKLVLFPEKGADIFVGKVVLLYREEGDMGPGDSEGTVDKALMVDGLRESRVSSASNGPLATEAAKEPILLMGILSL